MLNVVDDLLQQDDMDIHAAGDVGHELRDEVADGSGSNGSAVTRGGGAPACIAPGHIEVAEANVYGGSHEICVIRHAGSVIALRPRDLGDGMQDATPNRGIGHAVVMGILVCDGRNEKGAEEFAHRRLGVGHAEITREAVKPGTISRVRIGGYGDRGEECDGGEVIEIDCVAEGEDAFLARRERMNANIDETLEVIDVVRAAEIVGRSGAKPALAGRLQRRDGRMLAGPGR